MAPVKYTPDKPEFERWLAEGLTHQQMADRVFEQTGHRITRAAITVALSGYGLTTPKPRYKETVHWRVRMDHSKSYPVRMLRYLGRRQQGLPLTEKESTLLDAWLKSMAEDQIVVAYDPEDDIGFHYVDANFKDNDGEAPIRIKTIHLSKA
jgi:hypothetical protein